jgi:hypothetical protein
MIKVPSFLEGELLSKKCDVHVATASTNSFLEFANTCFVRSVYQAEQAN